MEVCCSFFSFFCSDVGGGVILVLEREGKGGNLRGEIRNVERNMDIKRIRANFGDVGDETREAVDFHTEMERRLRMDW